MFFVSKDYPDPDHLQWKEGELDRNKTPLFSRLHSLKSEVGAGSTLLAPILL